MSFMRHSAILRRIPLGLAIALSLLFNSGHAAAQEGLRYVVRSAGDCVRVREEPSTRSAEQDCLVPGSSVTVGDSAPYWRKITYFNDRTGWIAKKFIEPETEPGVAPSGPTGQENEWLEVHFIDVGQGDAIWITTPDDGIDGNGEFEGVNIVIDGGPDSDDAENRALAYIEERAHHGAVIDALFVTHPHTDHYRGAESLSRHFEIRDYYDPGYPSSAVGYTAFLNAMKGDEVNSPRAQRVHIGVDNFGPLDWGDELQAEVLYSWRDGAAGMGAGNTRENNSSIVLRLTYRDRSFLFMGDAEGKARNGDPEISRYVEKALLDALPDESLHSTVLKVGHHGSETSSTIPFMEAVDPQIVVAQSGRKSFNGRFIPDETALCRYCSHNADVEIYRTDEDDEAQGLDDTNDADGDDIVIRTNGTELTVEALSNGTPVHRNFCTLKCQN